MDTPRDPVCALPLARGHLLELNLEQAETQRQLNLSNPRPEPRPDHVDRPAEI